MRRHKTPCTFFLATLFVTLFAAPLRAQDTTSVSGFGRITGRIVDSASGLGIVGVGIQVVGTTIGVNSGIDGRFNLNQVPSGPLTIQVRRLGFAPKTITGLYLNGNQALEQNITMGQSVQQLAPAVVTAEAERGSANSALEAQMTSVGIISATTAEQISKSPDGNAAQAVQRVSGINLGENNAVTARGLSDKYTISSLNGARIPSPEPETRVVPLDLFPSGLIQSITTSKTFSPDLPGDFAGALVDIKTREFPAHRMWTAQIGQGYAAGATGSRLLSAQSAGGEAFGMVGGKRDLPQLLRYLDNFQGLTLTQGDHNNIINQFRNSWSPAASRAYPIASGSISVGGNDPILGRRIGYLVSGTFSSGTDIKENQVSALARGDTTGGTVAYNRFEGRTVSQSVLWGGVVNLSALVGNSSRFSVNGMYNRTADNDSRITRGQFEDDPYPSQITRMQYVERAVHSIQLVGEHQTPRHHIDWAATSSGVSRNEPDRSQFVQLIEPGTPGGPDVFRWKQSNGAFRAFSSLDEHSAEARGNYQFKFGSEARDHSLKVGGLYRRTTRDAGSREYQFYALNAPLSMRELAAEQLFGGQFTETGDTVFAVQPQSLGGDYSATERLAAGYGMLTYVASDRVRVIAGARYERDEPVVTVQPTVGDPATFGKSWSDVLPSLTVNVRVAQTSQIRMGLSQTVARPEYREIVGIRTQDGVTAELVEGNPSLERARIINADIRWEWYTGPTELVSIAVFAKQFDSPIERVYKAAVQGHVVTFVNAKGADNVGVELEWRHELSRFAERLQRYSFFTNLTLMHSEIRIGEDSTLSATNRNRAMMGQAPYVVNAGLTYTSEGTHTTATLLFNRVGDRVDAAGQYPMGDVVRRARSGLDLSVRFPIARQWSGRFDAKNLLDSPVSVTQGVVVREQYRLGRVIQGGVTWKP